ncbi:MAG: ABC transporter ATP-binding protein [Oscillibacter sp.]
MNAIELSHVNKRFGGFAIQDLTLAVPAGTICGLVGENGAGKSTTIRLMMNALQADSGTARVLGVDTASPDFLAVKQDVGVVLDEAYFPEVLSAQQVGKLMALTYTRWNQAQYEGYLSRFDLPQKKQFKDFSRGMRMKLAISVALSHAPKLLILDEATAGLDPIVRDEVLEIFNDFTREEDHSILLSSHILSDLEKLCDHIAFLHQGRLLFCDEKDRLLETYALFTGPSDQLDSLDPAAIVGREASGYGGARALVKRGEVPTGWTLERASVEDIILFLVKGAKQK